MIEFLNLPEDTRRQLINQVNARTGMSVKAIEKDWWVTLVLKALFSLPMSHHFIFKGGTSLSKGWKLIERFSEDIDIALAPEAFDKEYKVKPSAHYVKTLKKEGCIFTSTIIKDVLEKELMVMGVLPGMIQIEAEAILPTLPDKDPQSLYVHYPSLYETNRYIPDAVKIEFGVRSLKEPYSIVNIQSIIGEETESPVYKETPFPVTAVEPRKTFMEKLILLHEKFLIGMDAGDIGERQSRHLSDLRQMKVKGIAESAIQDAALYEQLTEHRRYYVRLKNLDYSKMHLSNLLFIPPVTLLDDFRRDYALMQEEMIYGNPPDFDALLDELRQLNVQLAGTGHAKDMQSVIAKGLEQVTNSGMIEGWVQTQVVYGIDPYRPVGHDNIDIIFTVEFIKTTSGFVLHRIKVAQKN